MFYSQASSQQGPGEKREREEDEAPDRKRDLKRERKEEEERDLNAELQDMLPSSGSLSKKATPPEEGQPAADIVAQPTLQLAPAAPADMEVSDDEEAPP